MRDSRDVPLALELCVRGNGPSPTIDISIIVYGELSYFWASATTLTKSCIRHSLIFDLPWPAHNSADVLDYPPPHLIPFGYVAPRISSIPLPSLDRTQKKQIEPAPVAPQAENGTEKRARKFREDDVRELTQLEQLHEEVWMAQKTHEDYLRVAEQAKIDARDKRLEAKRQREENQVKGTGLWQRYVYIDDEEYQRREAAKHAVTSGTRRGGRFKAAEDDEEEKKLAEEILARRRAEARAEETDSNADDEADDEEQEDEPDDQDGIVVGDEEVKPLVSPKKASHTPTGGKSYLSNHVIDITELTSESDSDSPKDMTGGKYQSKAKRRGIINSSAPPSPISPVRRTIKTDSSGKAKLTPSVVTDVDMKHVGREPDKESRGRGRPTGTGRKQKAAAARRTSLAEAGPSVASDLRMSIPEPSKIEQHIQTMIEKELEVIEKEEKMARGKAIPHEFMVEVLDKDGKFAWKSTGVIDSNPFSCYEAAIEYIVKEKMAKQSFLTKANLDKSSNVTTAPAPHFDRVLPGKQCLMSSAAARTWGPGPSRIKDPVQPQIAQIAQVHTAKLKIPPLPTGAPPHKVAAQIYDPGDVVSYDAPSITEGPWSNGQFRLVVAVERVGGLNSFTSRLNDSLDWNSSDHIVSSKIATPTIETIPTSRAGVDRANGPVEIPTPRTNGSIPYSSVIHSTKKKTSQPDTVASNMSLGIQHRPNTSVNGSISRVSTPSSDFFARSSIVNARYHYRPDSANSVIDSSALQRKPNALTSHPSATPVASRPSTTPSTSAIVNVPRTITPLKPVHRSPERNPTIVGRETAPPARTTSANNVSIPPITGSPVASASTHRAVDGASKAEMRPGYTPSDKSLVSREWVFLKAFPPTANHRPDNAIPTKAALPSERHAVNAVAKDSSSRTSTSPSVNGFVSRPAGSSLTRVDAYRPQVQKVLGTGNGVVSRSSTTPSKSLSNPSSSTVKPTHTVPIAIAPRPSITPSNGISRLNGLTPAKASTVVKERIGDKVGIPKTSNAPVQFSHDRPSDRVHGDAVDDNDLSTGNSLAEEEVEEVLNGVRKRKSSVTESVSLHIPAMVIRMLIFSHVE